MMTTLVLLLAAGAPATLGQSSHRDTLSLFQTHQISPLVLPGDLRSFTAMLGFDRTTQEVADLRYESYITELETVASGSIARDEEVRARLDAILKGRVRAAPEEVNQLRSQLETSKATNWPRADAAYERFIGDIIAVSPVRVSPETAARARFELHRRVYLRPARADGRDSRYAGEGLDFMELVNEARNAELRGISEDVIGPHLDAWRTAMMDALPTDSNATRQASLDDRVSRLMGDRASRIELMIERTRRWADRQTISYATFVAIYGVCRSVEDAAQWSARYRRATYPWLWVEGDDVERIADWIIANGTPEQMIVVNEIVSDYVARRDELRLEAEGILAAGRAAGANLCDDVAAFYEGAADPLQRLMKNSGKRSVLMRQVRAQLEQPLTTGQRAAVARMLLTGR